MSSTIVSSRQARKIFRIARGALLVLVIVAPRIFRIIGMGARRRSLISFLANFNPENLPSYSGADERLSRRRCVRA